MAQKDIHGYSSLHLKGVLSLWLFKVAIDNFSIPSLFSMVSKQISQCLFAMDMRYNDVLTKCKSP